MFNKGLFGGDWGKVDQHVEDLIKVYEARGFTFRRNQVGNVNRHDLLRMAVELTTTNNPIARQNAIEAMMGQKTSQNDQYVQEFIWLKGGLGMSDEEYLSGLQHFNR